jgi:hypothetical protein
LFSPPASLHASHSRLATRAAHDAVVTIAQASGEISAGCKAAAASYNNDKSTCDNAFDMDKSQLTPAEREAALCGTGKCLAKLRVAIVACKAELDQADRTGGLRFMAYILNGLQDMCPRDGETTGCYASLQTFEARMKNLNFDNGNIPADTQLEGVCGDKCVPRIIKFFLNTARKLGATEDDLLVARAQIRGIELLCQRDTAGKLCYRAFRAATDSGLNADAICPNACVRKSFKLFADLLFATDRTLAKDYGKLIELVCKRNDKQYCFKYLDDDDKEALCKDKDTKIQACLKEANAVEGCEGKILDANGKYVGATAPCNCIKAIADCEIRTIDTKCMDDLYDSCLTNVKQECQADVCTPFKAFQDPCTEVAKTSQCTDTCKAEATKSISDWGCCLGELVTGLEAFNEKGALAGLRQFSSMVRTVNTACSLGQDLAATCPMKGRVAGKAAIRGLTKAIVDANKDKFYAGFKSDMSSNTGAAEADITVTGHAAIEAGARRARKVVFSALQASAAAGVAFSYEIKTESPAAAAELQGTIEAEIKDNTLDLPALQEEAAKQDPGANLVVDTKASEAAADPAPSSGGSNSTATAVAASGAVVALTVIAALA